MSRTAPFLVPAACGGAVIGLADFALVVRGAADVGTGFALLELDLLAGVVLGFLAAAAFPTLERLRPFHRALAVAALAAVVAIPLGLKLFSGAGVSRTLLGKVGPWILPIVAALVGVVLESLVRAGLRGSSRARATLAAGAIVVGIVAVVAERRVLVEHYDYLHVVGVLVAIAAMGIASAALLPARAITPTTGAVALLVTMLGAAPVTIMFPANERARTLLVERRPAGERVRAAIAWAVDFDRDSASALFRGPDCDDFAAAIGPGQFDEPGNGIDEDCDGSDATAVLQRRPYGGSRARADELVRAASGRPTVVIVVDAMRADVIGRPELPALSRLAAESAWFVNAYSSASSTTLSVPGMLTGRARPLPSTPSAFEKLRARGVRTALVTCDIVADSIAGLRPVRAYPLMRGFEMSSLVKTHHAGLLAWGGGVKTPTDAEVTRRAFELLDGTPRPDVAWVHYFDLHQWKYLDGVQSEGVARYSEILLDVDAEVARWLERGDSVNVILTADHGEGLGDNGVETHTGHLWASLVRVPLLIRIPGVAGVRVESPVTVDDIAPTLLDMFGHATPEELGYSLLSLAGVPDPGQALFGAFEGRHVSAVDGRYRVIHDLHDRRTWLFDVLTDPKELRSLVEENPELADRMTSEAIGLLPPKPPARD